MFKHAQKDDELAHYGITGQKWGKRRWQYADGRFNPEGKERYFGSKSKKEKSSDTGVKDYIKYKNESSDQKQKFGGHIENNDISDEANKIYKKYKPNEWRRVLNTSDDLSTEDKIKLENELNKKLYKEDKHYARIVNNENVKNALREYIDSWNDVIKESNRIYSKEFMDNNPEAKDWSGDGTEYWYKFADKDISNRDEESYWKLREMVSSLSRKHGSWNNEIFDKVMSDLTEPVEDITDDSSKAYDKIKEHIGVDFRTSSQKFGSSEYDPDSQMKHFKMWNDVGKKIKTDGGNVRAIFESDEDLYDDNAQALILKNADKIHDMNKALQKGNDNKYFKVRNSFDNDYEKDLAEIFVGDKRSLDDYNNLIKDANKKLSKKNIDVQDYDESEDMWPSNIMKNTKQKEKIKETVNDLNDNYDKHNEIILNKLADMYYNAYKNTYGYEENPLTKSEFKQSFSNVTGTLLPSGKLEGYVESHEYGDDSFGTDYYFMYDILNKTLSNVEND